MKITNNNLYIKQYPAVEQPKVQPKTVEKNPPPQTKKKERNTAIQPDSTVNVPLGSHLVQDKETLYSIANHYETSVSELIDLNPDLKTDKNGNKIIYAGTIIKVSAATPKQETPKQQDNSTQVFGSWKIEKGKGAYSVMSKFNLYKEELQKLNPNINLDKIKTDDVFKVPGYKVKKDDCLENIAYAHGITVQMLVTLNPNSKELKIGDILNVPKLAGQNLGFDEIEVEFDEIESTPERITHTVKSGDSLSVIAQKYNVPMWAIMLHNGIKNEDKIFKGQVLEIPTKEETAELETKQKEITNKQSTQTEQKQKVLPETPKTETPENSIKNNVGIVIHKVTKEDTLQSISAKYNIPLEDLITYNTNLKGIKSSDKLSEKDIKNIKIIATKKAVMDGTGVSQKFIDDLISIEKKHNRLYNDACGIPTIGIGHNTRANNDTKKYTGRTLSDNEIYSLLARDIIKAQKNIKDAIGKDAFDKLSGGQKEALYGLIFNTGGLSGSPKLVAALKNGDYVSAACEMNQVSGTVNGKKQVLPGLAKRRFMDISKFMEASKLSEKDKMKVMETIQELYDAGFANIQRQNTKVDYNAYAKKFLGPYIDKCWITIKE